MTLKYNNTAGRLLAIFEIMLQKGADTDETMAVLARATGGTKGLGQLLERAVSVNDAFTKVKCMIKAKEPQRADLLLRGVNSFRPVVSFTGLRAPWGEAKREFTKESLYSLELCASLLPKEDEIPEDELQAIADATNELFEQVEKSDIDPILRGWILKLLSEIQESIGNYQIFGAEAFRESMSYLVGEIYTHKDAFNEFKKQQGESCEAFEAITAKVWWVMEKAAVPTALAMAGKEVLAIAFGS